MTDTPSDCLQTLLSWLHRQAIRLRTVEAGHGFEDLLPLKRAIGGARIVALGEATHGTREFFQLKHRLLEFLVIELGFTTFAIEANWPESRAVNDYVLHGRGDPAEALAGLHFWTWNTEEVLDQILWMRRYNADDAHQQKVTFAGFDAQYSALPATTIAEYLARVDPGFASRISSGLALFEKECRDYSHVSDADVELMHATVQMLTERLLAKKEPYAARSTMQEWLVALQHARILRQVDDQRRTGEDAKARYMIRDRAMAENAAWILEQEGPRRKMVVWAHNGHIARDPRGLFDGTVVSMGMHLAREFDRELVVVGFAFGEGAFQAMVKEDGNRRRLREVEVGPADDTFEAVLTRNGVPAFIVDLRDAGEDAAACLAEPHVTREIGAFFESPEEMRQMIVPSARYDLLAFIARTTRARPNP
jgi:erythromycin esterase